MQGCNESLEFKAKGLCGGYAPELPLLVATRRSLCGPRTRLRGHGPTVEHTFLTTWASQLLPKEPFSWLPPCFLAPDVPTLVFAPWRAARSSRRHGTGTTAAAAVAPGSRGSTPQKKKTPRGARPRFFLFALWGSQPPEVAEKTNLLAAVDYIYCVFLSFSKYAWHHERKPWLKIWFLVVFAGES